MHEAGVRSRAFNIRWVLQDEMNVKLGRYYRVGGSLILYSRSCPGALGDRAAYGDLPGSSRLKWFSLDLCGVMRCLWFRMVSEVSLLRDGDAVFRMSETGWWWIGCFFEDEGSWLLLVVLLVLTGA